LQKTLSNSQKIKTFFSKIDFNYTFIFTLMVLFYYRAKDIMMKETLASDGHYTWTHTTQSWRELFDVIYLQDNQQVLYYALNKIFYYFVPQNDFWLRFPALMYGIATLFLLFYFFYRIGRKHTAILASLLFTFSIPALQYSTFARPYSLVLLLVTINLIAFYSSFISKENVIQNSKRIFMASLILLAFTHSLFIPYFCAVLFSSLLFQNLRPKIIEYFLDKRLFILFFVPYVTAVYYQINNALHNSSWIQGKSFYKTLEYLLTFNLSFYAFQKYALLVSVLILIIFALLFKFRSKLSLWGKFNFSVVMMISTTYLIASHLFNPMIVKRYFCFVYPSLIFFVCCSFATFLKKKHTLLFLFPLIFFITENETTKYDFISRRVEVKQFFRDIDKKLVQDSNILCINKFWDVTEKYSILYHQRNICSQTLTDFITMPQTINQKTIIYAGNGLKDKIFKILGSNYKNIEHSKGMGVFIKKPTH